MEFAIESEAVKDWYAHHETPAALTASRSTRVAI